MFKLSKGSDPLSWALDTRKLFVGGYQFILIAWRGKEELLDLWPGSLSLKIYVS